jgi:hypothetical protein
LATWELTMVVPVRPEPVVGQVALAR